MSLDWFPQDILEQIAENLDDVHSLNAFSRISNQARLACKWHLMMKKPRYIAKKECSNIVSKHKEHPLWNLLSHIRDAHRSFLTFNFIMTKRGRFDAGCNHLPGPWDLPLWYLYTNGKSIINVPKNDCPVCRFISHNDHQP